MSQQNLLELAKQGNPTAIAALINHNLAPKGITVKVSRKDDCLRVLLESSVVPNQDDLIEFIHNGILKLRIAEITTLQILGRQTGNQSSAWSRTINLQISSPLPTSQQSTSDPQDSSSSGVQRSPVTHSGSESNPDSISLREAAKQGDLQAISSLISRAIAPRNIAVESTMQHGITLWLKIYPQATMKPQSCVQAVISVLNDLQPNNVRSVRISEMSSDNKKQVWNRFLALKNDKFVDNTTSINISLGVVVLLILGFVGYCAMPKQPDTASQTATYTAPTSVQTPNQSQQAKWYQGGSLHTSGALEWQQATYENKLATCADFVSGMWQNKKLNPSIQNQIKSMDDIRVLAQELVKQMDAALEENSNPEENRQIYANQKVNEIAALLMISMGWLK